MVLLESTELVAHLNFKMSDGLGCSFFFMYTVDTCVTAALIVIIQAPHVL